MDDGREYFWHSQWEPPEGGLPPSSDSEEEQEDEEEEGRRPRRWTLRSSPRASKTVPFSCVVLTAGGTSRVRSRTRTMSSTRRAVTERRSSWRMCQCHRSREHRGRCADHTTGVRMLAWPFFGGNGCADQSVSARAHCRCFSASDQEQIVGIAKHIPQERFQRIAEMIVVCQYHRSWGKTER